MSEAEFPTKGSSGGGSTPAYSVQARTIGMPEVIGGVVYTDKWRTVSFEKVNPPFGVPSFRGGLVDELGLLTYEAAQALRWWFHANNQHKIFSLQTRLVKHIVEHSYSSTIVGAFDFIGDSDRPAFQEPKDPTGKGES